MNSSNAAFSLIPRAIAAAETMSLRALYDEDRLFRSRIVMERHRFGKGEYKYFADPLPAPKFKVCARDCTEQLLPVANEWMRRLGRAVFPETHQAFLHECLAGEQSRPTALAVSGERVQSAAPRSLAPSPSRCRRRSI